jgi:hypothetical protein
VLTLPAIRTPLPPAAHDMPDAPDAPATPDVRTAP